MISKIVALQSLLLMLVVQVASAQSLRITQVRLESASRDTTEKTISLSFNMEWAASRQEGENRDFAWIFAKFEREPGVWADLRFVPEKKSVGMDGGTVDTPSILPAGYATGLVVSRPANVYESARFTIRGLWTYGASYFELPQDGVPLRVFGIEMVHVPGGPFDVGESGTDARRPNSFRSEIGEPFRIVAEDEIPVQEASGLFYDVREGEAYAGGDQKGPVPDAFPKGFEPFYIMKYPITQGQYADFLTSLPPRARSARDVTQYPSYKDMGGAIDCTTVGCETTHPNRAANFLSWADGIGWASWAGLRPMTEFEFEKAAAGTVVDSARYADGMPPNEVADSDRRSDWGVVDLRGGLWERVVSIGTAEGRAYRGSPGQGFVDDLGYPYGFANPDWPGPRALGSGYRGGTEGVLGLSEIADRTYGAYEATYGNEGQGFRAVLDER